MSDEPVEDVERHDDGRPGVTVEQHFPEGEPDQAEPVCAVTELSSLTAEVLVVFGDLAARWHSVAHERLHAGDDYTTPQRLRCARHRGVERCWIFLSDCVRRQGPRRRREGRSERSMRGSNEDCSSQSDHQQVIA